MIVFIPMATGVEMRTDVRASIMEQSLNGIHIIETHRPGVIHSQRVMSLERYAGEVASREACRQGAIDSGSSIVIIQDPDILHRDKSNFAEMLEFLADNKKAAAVCLWKEYGCGRGFSTDATHVDIGCMAVRTSILGAIQFHWDGDGCICNTFKKDVEALGMSVQYLNEIRACEELN